MIRGVAREVSETKIGSGPAQGLNPAGVGASSGRLQLRCAADVSPRGMAMTSWQCMWVERSCVIYYRSLA